MDYPVEQLVREVKVAIDENVSSEALNALGDLDTLKLDEIIESKVEDAARLVVLESPHWLLGQGEEFSGNIEWRDDLPGAGRILLDTADWLRLVAFQMSDWPTGVIEAIGEDDPRYLMQSSRFAGIRGNTERPVVAIVHYPEGLALEFFSSASTRATIKRATYIPMPRVNDGQIALCPKLYSATVYKTASLAALSVGNVDLAKSLVDTCNELLQ